MAFVSVPKDLSRVKSKLAFNMTKRQLICFGIAAVIGIPTYIFTRGVIGNSAAVIVMICLMLPLFLLGMYEKDGQPAEKVIRNYIRTTVYYPGTRPYKSENFYATIEKEAKIFATKRKGAAKKAVRKRPASEREPH
jgi:acetate kinase